MKRRSPAFKFTAIFALAIVLVVLVVVATNTFGLRPFYESRKTKTMQEAYEKIDAAVSAGSFSELEEALTTYSESDNISIAVYDSFTNLALFSSERDNEYLLERLQNKLFGTNNKVPTPPDGEPETNPGTVIETDDYTITRGVRDLEFFGYCRDNRTMVIMACPMEAINKNASQTNQFLLIVAGVAFLVGFIAVIFLTSRASRTYALEVENEKLQRQNEIQREFVGNVSHELKTPITLIQGYAEGLQDGMCENEESRKNYCGIIVEETKRMNEIVQQLLMLSKIESGSDETIISNFDFSELVMGVAENIKILADQKNVNIELNVPEGIIVSGDDSKIESVVTNYLSNAIHHVNDGGTIRVSCERKAGRVHLTVFNTGNNIPEEELTHIWDKFYKIDKAHSRTYGGSGIGLSIVRAVMEAHNMPYGVNNMPDGVEFWFELEEKKNDKQ